MNIGYKYYTQIPGKITIGAKLCSDICKHKNLANQIRQQIAFLGIFWSFFINNDEYIASLFQVSIFN